MREALVAEMLGDVDVLLKRIEALPAALDAVEGRIEAAAERLAAVAERIRGATLAMQEATRRDITALVQLRAAEAAADAARVAAAEIREAVVAAMREATAGQAGELHSLLRSERGLAAALVGGGAMVGVVLAGVVALAWRLLG